ncbi:MAG: FMN-binding protein [bacterium]|nr:FMN-binding protein [bacterium]
MDLPEVSDRSAKPHRRRVERWLAVAALLSIACAWWVGSRRVGLALEPSLRRLVPEAGRIEPLGSDSFMAWSAEEPAKPMAYIAIASGDGYGGPLQLAVAVDPQGSVLGVEIVEERETPSYLHRVLSLGFLDDLVGKSYEDSFEVGNDVDAVTGATRTVTAVVEAAKEGSRAIAATQLGRAVPTSAAIRVRIGFPEVALALLFAVGFVGLRSRAPLQRWLRWVSMLAGLVILGFVLNQPLTIAFVNRLLLGFWPAWQTHLYWYLLVSGIVLVIAVDGRNPYCEWFCPFGAAQECLGVIGGGRARVPSSAKNFLLWLQRGLALLAIILALLFRHPGISGYEVFGALFEFVGSRLQFILLALVLVVALFVRRPWCNLLCPLRPVTDLLRMFRNWIREAWKTR